MQPGSKYEGLIEQAVELLDVALEAYVEGRAELMIVADREGNEFAVLSVAGRPLAVVVTDPATVPAPADRAVH